MRPLALALALLALGGCAQAPDFNLVIENVGTETTWLRAGEGSGVLVQIEQEVKGEWVTLVPSLAWLCTEQCGVPGAITCADVAAELSDAWALLPGDQAVREYTDKEFWYVDPVLNCAQKSSLQGGLRATVCHGPEAVDSNTSETIEEPDESGPTGGGGGAEVVDAECTTVALDLQERPDLLIEVAD